MEVSNNPNPEKEISPEELNRLLSESYLWAKKIIRDDPDEEWDTYGSANATTQEAKDANRDGYVAICNFGHELAIKVHEDDYSEKNEDTTQYFMLSFSYDTNEYALMTPGKKLDLNERNEPEEADEDLKQEEWVNQLHPASTAEIQHLALVLELGAFGDEHFNFKRFQRQFRKYLHRLNAVQDENHPE